MVREPVFDDPKDGLVMPVGCVTLDEVKAAASDCTPLFLPLAYVTRRKESAFPLKLENIRDVCEYDDGSYLFVGDAVQHVMTVLHRHEIETTVRLEGRSSVCAVLITRYSASMTFSTVVTITECTESFLDAEE